MSSPGEVTGAGRFGEEPAGPAEPRLEWPDTPSIFGPFTIDVPAEGAFPGGSAPMPDTIPFGLAFMLWEIHDKRGAVDLEPAEIVRAARLGFGGARVDEWLGQGVTHEALEAALDEAVTEYGRRRSEEAALAAEGRRLLIAHSRQLIEEAVGE